MATELVTFKMNRKFLKEVDDTVKNSSFHNRTEFIRNALRENVDKIKLKKAMQEIAHLKGASGKKTTDEEIHRVRQKVFEEFDKELR